MSKIADAYNAMITRVSTLLPSHVRLPNVYRVPQNPDPYLSQGYGIQLGSAQNTNRNLGCKLSVERQMVVVISRKFYAREYDPEEKATTEKQLFEDQFLVIKDMEKDPTLNNTVMMTKYLSDTGIQFVDAENKEQYMFIESTFSVEYLEDLT